MDDADTDTILEANTTVITLPVNQCSHAGAWLWATLYCCTYTYTTKPPVPAAAAGLGVFG